MSTLGFINRALNLGERVGDPGGAISIFAVLVFRSRKVRWESSYQCRLRGGTRISGVVGVRLLSCFQLF